MRWALALVGGGLADNWHGKAVRVGTLGTGSIRGNSSTKKLKNSQIG
jgi:hypothetical protein